MNIALLIIDTLRYDYLRANGNDAIETPNMDRLASESLCFDRAFSASYPTIPHRRDVITGQYGGPFHAWLPLSHDDLALPWVLANSGYATQLIHDTPHLVNGGHNFDWPFHAWTFVRGAEVDRPLITDDVEWPENWAFDPLFDCLSEDVARNNRTAITYSRANLNRERYEDWNCARLFSTASEFLRLNSRRDNFFLWVDCFDPHEPWDVPPEFVLKYDKTPGYDGRTDPRQFGGRNSPDLPQAAKDRVKAHYSAKVTWVDHWLGTFLDTLEETGLAKDTVVILTADHGTNNGERGKFGKGYPVREQEAHVPFIVRHPEVAHARSNMIVQPQDVFATVLGVLGRGAPAAMESHDLIACAKEGGAGRREIALAGSGSGNWQKEGVLFSAFNDEWALEVHAKPEDSTLTRLGTLDCVECDHPKVVQEMHAAAIGEIERRGADPVLIKWIRDGGDANPPAQFKSPARSGYYPYFGRIYSG